MKTRLPGVGEIERRRTIDRRRDWYESCAVIHGPKEKKKRQKEVSVWLWEGSTLHHLQTHARNLSFTHDGYIRHTATEMIILMTDISVIWHSTGKAALFWGPTAMNSGTLRAMHTSRFTSGVASFIYTWPMAAKTSAKIFVKVSLAQFDRNWIKCQVGAMPRCITCFIRTWRLPMISFWVDLPPCQ